MLFRRSTVNIVAAFVSAIALVGGVAGSANASTVFEIVNPSADVRICVTPYGGGVTKGTLLVQWACNGDLSQEWTYRATDWGNLIVNKKSGLCITPSGGGIGNGTNLTLWYCDPHEVSQKWGTDGNGIIVNLNSGKYIAPFGGGFESGTQLTLWKGSSYSGYDTWSAI
jgi:hypothetical protein